MAGRPTKLTEDLKEQLCRLISAGNYINTACQVAGITEQAFHSWIRRGLYEEEGIYHDFARAVERAEAQAKARNVAIIQAAAKDDWRAALTWLERRYPEEWGKHNRFLCREEMKVAYAV